MNQSIGATISLAATIKEDEFYRQDYAYEAVYLEIALEGGVDGPIGLIDQTITADKSLDINWLQEELEKQLKSELPEVNIDGKSLASFVQAVHAQVTKEVALLSKEPKAESLTSTIKEIIS